MVRRLLLALALLLVPSLAHAQGSGLFIVKAGTGRPSCASITNPVQGLTWCFDGNDATPTLKAYIGGGVYVGGSGVPSVNGLSGPLAIVGTGNQVNVISAGSTITLSGPQNLAPANSPTFVGLTLSGLGAGNTCLQATLGIITGTGAPCGAGGAGVSAINALTGGLTLVGVANRTTVTSIGTTLTVTLPNDVSGLTSLGATTLNATTLNATGFITGLLRDKGGQTFNVKSYGAAGDANCTTGAGTTDNTAINDALTAAAVAGGEVFFPPSAGAYKMTTALVLPSGVRLRGSQPSVFGVSLLALPPGVSVVCGVHTDVVVDLKGASGSAITDLMLYGSPATTPKVGILQARNYAGGALPSAGFHRFNNVTVDGSYTVAAWYSIASEESRWNDVFIRVAGGGAKFNFLTSQGDALSLRPPCTGGGSNPTTCLGPSSNLNGTLVNVWASSVTNDATASILYFDVGQQSRGWSVTGAYLLPTAGSFVTVRTGQTDACGGSPFVCYGGPTFTAVNGENAGGGLGPHTGFNLDAPGNFTLSGLQIIGSSFTYGAGAKFLRQASGLSLDSTEVNASNKQGVGSVLDASKITASVIDAGDSAQKTIYGGVSVLGVGDNRPVRITGVTTGPARLDFYSGATNAQSGGLARNWGWRTDLIGFGDYGLKESPTLGGDPLAGPMRLYFAQNGNLCVGCTAPAALLDVRGQAIISPNGAVLPAQPSGSVLQLAALNAQDTYLTADAFGAQGGLIVRRANGTPGARTTLLADQPIGAVAAQGAYDATNYSAFQASIGFFSGGTWSNVSRPAYVTLGYTPVGSTALTEGLRLASDGSVFGGNPSFAGGSAWWNFNNVLGSLALSKTVLNAAALEAFTTTVAGNRSGKGSVTIPTGSYGPGGPSAVVYADAMSMVNTDGTHWPDVPGAVNNGVGSGSVAISRAFGPTYSGIGVVLNLFSIDTRNPATATNIEQDHSNIWSFLVGNSVGAGTAGAVNSTNVLLLNSRLSAVNRSVGLQVSMSNFAAADGFSNGINIGAGDLANCQITPCSEFVNGDALNINTQNTHTSNAAFTNAIRVAFPDYIGGSPQDRFRVANDGSVFINVPAGFVGHVLDAGINNSVTFTVSENGDIGTNSVTIRTLAGAGNRTLCINNAGVVYTVASGAAC